MLKDFHPLRIYRGSDFKSVHKENMWDLLGPLYIKIYYIALILLAEKEKPICMAPVSQTWFGHAYAFQIHSV